MGNNNIKDQQKGRETVRIDEQEIKCLRAAMERKEGE